MEILLAVLLRVWRSFIHNLLIWQSVGEIDVTKIGLKEG